jgi:hypothetical protein
MRLLRSAHRLLPATVLVLIVEALVAVPVLADDLLPVPTTAPSLPAVDPLPLPTSGTSTGTAPQPVKSAPTTVSPAPQPVKLAPQPISQPLFRSVSDPIPPAARLVGTAAQPENGGLQPEYSPPRPLATAAPSIPITPGEAARRDAEQSALIAAGDSPVQVSAAGRAHTDPGRTEMWPGVALAGILLMFIVVTVYVHLRRRRRGDGLLFDFVVTEGAGFSSH